MELLISISARAELQFGEDIRKKIEDLVEREAERLYHVERSKPKEKPVPASRSSLAQGLGEQLLRVYARKRARYAPQPLPERFALQEQAVHEHMASGDVGVLKEMLRTMPWVEK